MVFRTGLVLNRAVSATTGQRERAARFAALHEPGGEVLVLANAWDVASARLVEDAGATAVATTSAGVAWSLGEPDGDRLARDPAMALVARVVAAVEVPVTADLESGFADDDAALAVTVRAVVEAGAVGVNVEDAAGAGLRPAAEQAARLAVIRRTADAAGVGLFVNARIDTYLRGVGEPGDARLAETVRRAEAYLAAGANGIFVPGVVDPDTVRRLVAEIDAPLNLLVGPGAPPVGELAALGVRRISVGSGIASAAYALTRRAAVELLTAGTYTALEGGIAHAEMNAVLGA